MNKLLTLLGAFLLLSSHSLFAQGTISGKVTDPKGAPLAGISVYVHGTTIGTSTGSDGSFSLDVLQNEVVLDFSGVGFIPKSETVTVGTPVAVQLVIQNKALTEVVVTALGISKAKYKLGYSTATFNSAAINRDAPVSMMDGLAGKIAGATISQTGGPGSSTKVILRGYGVIGGGNNQPLYVIDGVPLSDALLNGSGNTAGSFTPDVSGNLDFGNGSTSVNPSDIESITVLKGTAATAKYGSTAKNGAIIITTKKGRPNGKLKIAYTGSLDYASVGKLPEMQSEFGQGWNGQFILSENGSWGPKLDGVERPWGATVDNSQLIKPFSAVKNNIRNFYTLGTGSTNNISLSGGDKTTGFYFSYGNVSNNGIIPTKADYLERNTFTLRTNSVFNNFSFNSSFNYINRNQNAPFTGQGSTDGASIFESLLQIPVDIPIHDFSAYKNKFFNVDNYFSPYGENPYYPLNENGANQKSDRFFGNIDMQYKFLKHFTAEYRLGGDFTNMRTHGWKQPNAPSPGSWDAGNNVEGAPRAVDVGTVIQSSDYYGTLNSDLIVSYNKDLSKDFTLDALVGGNFYQSAQRNQFAYITNLVIPGFFNLSNSSNPPITSDFISLRRRLGVYAEATVGFKDQLFVTGNIRNDWSSTLPINNNAIFYPGVNGAWIASTTFDLSKTPISYLKFRAGYGQTGSDPDPYQTNTKLRSGDVTLGFGSLNTPFNGTPAFGLSNIIPNPDLKPIITSEVEGGTEIGLFKDRISLEVTGYQRKTNGQIFTVPIAPSTGYAQPSPGQTNAGAVENIGLVTNTGIEITLGAKIIQSKAPSGFNWRIDYTYAKNNNEVNYLTNGLQNVVINTDYDAELRATPGQSVSELYALGPEMVNGKIVVNAAGLPQAASNKVDYGSTLNKYAMGLTNTFTYKSFSLDCSLDFRYGGVMYSGTADLVLFTGNGVATTYNDRKPFVVPNSVMAVTDGSGNVTYATNTQQIGSTQNNTYWYPTSNPGTSYQQRIFDRSFLKMRDITLVYSLPVGIMSKAKISAASIGVYARNLLLWVPKANVYVDPESTNLGNDLAGELGEFRSAPVSKNFGVVLNVTF
ncbi:MAG TPA: SusC/RagA family TonB-linked outer membrane protein [Ferruginibacter sp.]|nr:SusC/RagA family TonB-linked outer membrane protein [Ferruginibacter sp.]